MTTAQLLLGDVTRRIVAPRRAETVDQWADRVRVLTGDASSEAGPMRIDRTPHNRYPMRMFTHPWVDRISIAYASQCAKTELLICCVGYVTENDPSPVMWMWPNEDGAFAFNTDRFTPSVEESPAWAGNLRSESSREKKLNAVHFVSCTVMFRGSGSQAKARGTPVKYRFADEIDADEFERERLEDLEQRAAAWPGGKLVMSSIPSIEGDGIDGCVKAAGAGAHRYNVPCPECYRYQPLLFEHVRWDGPARRDNAERARSTAYYACPYCGCQIREHAKSWMTAWGLWLPQDATVTQTDHVHPEPTAMMPPPGEAGITPLPGCTVEYGAVSPDFPSRHMAFHGLSSLYSPWVRWGTLAAKWCEAGGEPRPTFINGSLAEPYSPKGDKVDPEQCIKLCGKVETRDRSLEQICRSHGAYRLGELPSDVLVVTAGVDLQRDRAYVVLRGWSELLRQSWLLWFNVVQCPHSDPAASQSALEALLQTRVGDGEYSVKASRWAIDSGDGTRTKEVYEFARKHPGVVFACKGAHGNPVWTTQQTQIDFWPGTKVKIPGGVRLLWANTCHFKGALLGKLKQAPAWDPESGARSALEAQTDESARWFWPDPDADADGRSIRPDLIEYFNQITAEHFVPTNIRQIEKGARPIHEWKMRPGRKDNHFLDAEVYCQSVAHDQFSMLTRAAVNAYRERVEAAAKAPASPAPLTQTQPQTPAQAPRTLFKMPRRQ